MKFHLSSPFLPQLCVCLLLFPSCWFSLISAVISAASSSSATPSCHSDASLDLLTTKSIIGCSSAEHICGIADCRTTGNNVHPLTWCSSRLEHSHFDIWLNFFSTTHAKSPQNYSPSTSANSIISHLCQFRLQETEHGKRSESEWAEDWGRNELRGSQIILSQWPSVLILIPK